MPDPQAPAPFEGSGVFYLGRPYDIDAGRAADAPLLYDSSDLTTHGFIVGMTGSGKTGLGIGLIEEAALDGIPVLAIDPKGDLPNLMLTFPELRPEDFQPWVSQREAQEKGVSTEVLAAQTAETWQKGLADWGQGPERIRRLRDTAEFAV
jgi:DNA helicase HerA-like ATPase